MNPIIAKMLTVGVACSRDSRLQGVYALQGAPTVRIFAMIGFTWAISHFQIEKQLLFTQDCGYASCP
jgi:hypothetical protein